MITKMSNVVPALLLSPDSSRNVVPALSLEQQLRDDVAAGAGVQQQQRDIVAAEFWFLPRGRRCGIAGAGGVDVAGEVNFATARRPTRGQATTWHCT